MKIQYKYIKFSSKKMLLCVFVVSILNVTLAFEKTFEIFTRNKKTNKLQLVTDGPFGGTGGYSWNDVPQLIEYGPITGMEIIQNDKDINAIRAQYGEHWGEWHGNVDGGEPRLFFLNDGAHIEFVEGRSDDVIIGMEFICSDGSVYGPFGGSGGSPWVSAHPGCALSYISGASGQFLDSISFHYLCEDDDYIRKTEETSTIEDGPFGGSGGISWTDGTGVHLNGNVTAIAIRSDDEIDAIRVRYGRTWGEWHGGQGGQTRIFEFNQGAVVDIVQGLNQDRINQIKFVTSDGSVYGPFGGNDGNSWVSPRPVPNCFLSYLSGKAGDRLDSLTMHYEC